jgi:sulfite reductase (NADPH) flavoprotein alpha-component
MNPVTLVPEHAPFSPEQRAWLNGFFAGMLGTLQNQAGDKVVSLPTPIDISVSSNSASLAQTVAPAPSFEQEAAPAEDEQVEDHDFPWHDPGLSMDQRLALADGRPLKRQLMAAMAQFDCGACGYVCQTYSEAIASGQETCLDLCAPGGSETEQQLRKIVDANRQLPVVHQVSPAKVASPPSKAVAPTPLPGFDRKQPITARFMFAKPLNQAGSSKDTRHVALRFESHCPAYRPGDALGVFPTNDPRLVEQILQFLQIDGMESVRTTKGETKTLFGALVEDCCLKTVPENLGQRLGVSSHDPNNDVLDTVMLGTLGSIGAQEFYGLLRPMQPRLYSISSSPKKYPSEIHLTVGRVEWNAGARTRLGVASNMFASRLVPRESLNVFVHRPQAFQLPQDSTVPIIMVGPGTGIAPFIGFLQEREAIGASGRNWLFFGDQHAATDFLYEDQIRTWHRSGVLGRLETAFSRDQSAKVYVQDRLLEYGREVYQWLQAGAHFYVCGDAKSMAASVQLALQQIIATFGGITFEAAGDRIKELQKEQRYQRDVY